MDWKYLTSKEQIDEIKKHSSERSYVIFKHSTSCPISSMAKMRLEDKWDINNIEAYYLDLLKYRDISNQVAETFDVHHESPQLLLIVDGECIYDASHFDITVDELKESLVS